MNETIDAEYQETTALAVQGGSRALATPMPTVSPVEAREAMRQYIAVCDAVLTADDYQSFKQWDPVARAKVEKRFKKKSAVKKLQTFWSINVAVRDVVRDDLGDGHFGFRCVAIATTPSGRSVEATGGCSTYEERFTPKRFDNDSDAEYATKCRLALARSYHDVMSTAETRATNRAVMNCIGVGGGEVTADEISRERDPQPTQRRAAVPPKDEPPKAPTVRELVERARDAKIVDGNATFEEQRDELKALVLADGEPWTIRGLMTWLESRPAPETAAAAPGKADHPTDAQRRLAMTLHGELGHDDDFRHDYYEHKYGVRSFNDLTVAQATDLIDTLNRNVDAQNAASQ